MDIPVSKSIDCTVALGFVALLACVCGHVWMPELVAWVQWFISDVIEPAFGLNDLVLS